MEFFARLFQPRIGMSHGIKSTRFGHKARLCGLGAGEDPCRRDQ